MFFEKVILDKCISILFAFEFFGVDFVTPYLCNLERRTDMYLLDKIQDLENQVKELQGRKKGQSFFHARSDNRVAHCIALSDVSDGLVKVLRTEYMDIREEAALTRPSEVCVLIYDRNKIFDWTSDVIKEVAVLIEERKKPMTLADITPEHIRAGRKWDKS